MVERRASDTKVLHLFPTLAEDAGYYLIRESLYRSPSEPNRLVSL